MPLLERQNVAVCIPTEYIALKYHSSPVPNICKTAEFSVVLNNPGGHTSYPGITGIPDTEYDDFRKVFYVCGIGNLARTPASIDPYEPGDGMYVPKTGKYMPATSQFNDKLHAHEAKHKQDLDNGFDGHTFFVVSELYGRLQGLENSTHSGLMGEISREKEKYKNEEENEMDGLVNILESRAYPISDPVPPLYYYYNTCEE